MVESYDVKYVESFKYILPFFGNLVNILTLILLNLMMKPSDQDSHYFLFAWKYM